MPCMAGCRPEYLPVVLAAVEGACTDEFNMHGLLATTYFSGPVLIVNGPVARAIGMNSGVNALGQGNRANATIGRALQLVVRNVGGGDPGGVDRATLGNPGKLSFCFAEDEAGSPWEPLSVARGVAAGVDAVTLFAGDGAAGHRRPAVPRPRVAGPVARRAPAQPPTRSWCSASTPCSWCRPSTPGSSPRPGGTGRGCVEELTRCSPRPGTELVRGAGGIAEGLPEALRRGRPARSSGRDGLLVVHAGGGAGLFSAIIGGWVSGDAGSQPVTREVRP